ncbi:MAG: hypothetical protein DMF60_19840 [Acidobacteria bacterium]|nr:MAG: hypothetical protein DMF60_19840 [Acidobacteriota bacterium]
MVIVGAILVFVAGVSLLVYFYRRYKKIEKEPEEERDLSRRSLFVNVPPPAKKAEEASGPVTTEASEPVPETPAAWTGGTREFASGIELIESAPSTTELPLETAALQEVVPPGPEVEPEALPESRPTEVLASPAPPEPVAVEATESASFDDEVWAGLELDERTPLAEEEPVTPPPLQSAEPPPVARVEQHSQREPFVAPRIQRIEHREPYETPSIERLTPREQSAVTQELRSARPPQVDQPGGDWGQTRHAGATGLFGSLPRSSSVGADAEAPRVATETRELATAEPSSARIPEPSIVGPHAHRAATGSVLGLPAEPSYGPLILGDVVRNSSDVGIDALSNYGKDIGPKGGRGGTIALLLVVGLLGGAVLLYLLVPSVHSRVGSLVGQVRGTNAQAAREAAMKPKVQIFPSRLEVNKNMVTARGSVDNISDEPIENLSLEVSMKRGDNAPPEIRSVSVVPNPLPAGQRGTFEFEYDGKRDTGFSGYSITRLFSNGTEVKFRTPGK